MIYLSNVASCAESARQLLQRANLRSRCHPFHFLSNAAGTLKVADVPVQTILIIMVCVGESHTSLPIPAETLAFERVGDVVVSVQVVFRVSVVLPEAATAVTWKRAPKLI